ncbi:phospho-N-acetylmuramoyl-pentapeptide-transferase [Alkalicoccus luteus]|uniref:Phospho-N-acetylmuramoyl-pentapeptide-transferase n=1 Tax=Alkalicoccus luteus TaxID=1237094 RepID=A0A969PLM1_9BACI|nr:phospho-N-acetylmuramoyl-pentapeptide-transferase [Alkalicoccus luteus]NJP36447.1 phospho-N-acetylmuramoyl-pentapeptide-transferase [Alkalicoccus luteus]
MFDTGLIPALITAFILTVIISPIVIPYLRRLKFGQSIREEGPQSHQKKTGTPTMGGLIILGAAVIASAAASAFYYGFNIELVLIFIVLLGFGLLGFLDDYIKVVKKRNLGLTSKQKFLGQVGISTLVYIILLATGLSTEIGVPGTDLSVDIGWLYFPLIIVMLVGASNAVNLTDGLDGLVAGTAAAAFTAFAVIAYSAGLFSTAVFAMALTGALLGFLIFNAHPAKVFMGDTGSLAIGGALAMTAVLTKTELLLVIIGGVFVIETLSVILQVASFKLRKKRIFKMSPIHHHFELSGWSEWRVVATFWTIGVLCAAAGIMLEVL